MSIDERIEKYYIERIDKCSGEIEKAIESILGLVFKAKYLLNRRGFKPIFVASKKGIEYHLGNTPLEDEKEIMEYLLDRMDEEERTCVVISSKSDYEKKYEDFFDKIFKGELSFLEYYNPVIKSYCRYYKMDIFGVRDGLELDVRYIFNLLLLLLTEFDEKKRVRTNPRGSFSVNCDIEYANLKIYDRILSTIALQIVSLLRQKKVYIFENEEDYNLELANGKYNMVDPKFISAFQDLIPMFLLEPKKFIEIVGEDNFRDFTICSLDGTSDLDIDNIIKKMVDKRNSNIRGGISINPVAVIGLNKIADLKIRNGSYEPIIPVEDLELLDWYTQMDVKYLKELIEHRPIESWPRSEGLKHYIKYYLENPDDFKKNVFGGLFDVSKRGRVKVSWLGYIIENTPKEELQADLKNGFFDGESDAVIYCLNKYANSSYDYPKVYPDVNFQLDDFEISSIESYVNNYSPDKLKDMLKDGKLNFDSFAVRYYVRKYIKYGEDFEMPRAKKRG